MKQPKVSIIVPVFNTEKYLDKCFESLVNQTLQEIEIVVINDGSTDGSGAIIDRYSSLFPDKFLCFEKENGGQGAARNIGIEKCHGKYIGFLDSDDFVRNDMFEKLYLCAEKNMADYVACGYTDVYQKDGNVVVINEYVSSPVASTPRDLFVDVLVSPFIHLYKAEMVKASGVRFPEGMIYEDTAFFINLIPFIKKMACLEEALPYRVRHAGSTTAVITAARVRQIFPVISNIINWYNEHGFINDFKDEIEYFCARILLGSSMERVSRISKARDRKDLIYETFAYLHNAFPQYQKNTYFSEGIKNFVFRSLTPTNCGLYILVFRMKRFIKKGWQ